MYAIVPEMVIKQFIVNGLIWSRTYGTQYMLPYGYPYFVPAGQIRQ